MGWFLYDNGLRHERVNLFTAKSITTSSTLNNTLGTFLVAYMQTLNKKMKLMKRVMKLFSFCEKLLHYENYNSIAFWALKIFLEEFRNALQ